MARSCKFPYDGLINRPSALSSRSLQRQMKSPVAAYTTGQECIRSQTEFVVEGGPHHNLFSFVPFIGSAVRRTVRDLMAAFARRRNLSNEEESRVGRAPLMSTRVARVLSLISCRAQLLARRCVIVRKGETMGRLPIGNKLLLITLYCGQTVFPGWVGRDGGRGEAGGRS